MRYLPAAVVFALALTCPRAATAQVTVQVVEAHKRTVSGAIGRAVTGSEFTPGAPAVAFSYERRLDQRWFVRLEIEHTRWDLRPLTSPYTKVVNAARMSLSSLTAAVIKTAGREGPVRPYAGGGLGVYKYRFAPDAIGSESWPGAFVLFGLQFDNPPSRYGAFVEFSLGLAHGPERAQMTELYLSQLAARAGFRYSF